MRIIFYIMLAIFLQSCATSEEIYMSDGAEGHIISCDGSMQSLNDCFKKAGTICGSLGYKLIHKNIESSPSGFTYGYIGQQGMIVLRGIMVKCNES